MQQTTILYPHQLSVAQKQTVNHLLHTHHQQLGNESFLISTPNPPKLQLHHDDSQKQRIQDKAHHHWSHRCYCIFATNARASNSIRARTGSVGIGGRGCLDQSIMMVSLVKVARQSGDLLDDKINMLEAATAHLDIIYRSVCMCV